MQIIPKLIKWGKKHIPKQTLKKVNSTVATVSSLPVTVSFYCCLHMKTFVYVCYFDVCEEHLMRWE